MTYGSRIVHLERRDNRWRLETDDGAEAGRFDAVVISAPAPQTAALLATPAAHLAERAAEVDPGNERAVELKERLRVAER